MTVEPGRPEGYRADIDGLRAVAVVLVLFYHTAILGVRGGFIGVDVFFAISGYLITGILIREMEAGSFTFTRFYQRRISRLLPAMVAVYAVTSVAAVVLQLPTDLVAYAKSLVSALLGSSNVLIWREYGGYFNANVGEVPLLHTWSLAVEEQYYLLWPAFLLLSRRMRSARGVVVLTSGIFVASLALSELLARRDSSASYYLLPTRAFELMVGSLLALSVRWWGPLGRRMNGVLSIGGLLLILGAAFGLSKDSVFPGINALAPVLGTGLLLVSGRGQPGPVNRLLATRPFVGIGLISYSLYLWHWPFIAFVNYLGFALTPTVAVGVIVASTALATASYWWVERPFRGRPRPFRWVFTRLFLVPVGVAVLFLGIVVGTRGLRARFSAEVVAMDSTTTLRSDTRSACHADKINYRRLPSPSCRLGAGGADARRGLLVGDSHANHLVGFVDELARRGGVTVQDYTLGGCIPLISLRWGGTAYGADRCRVRNDIVRDHIAAERPDFVILAASWPRRDSVSNVFLDGSEMVPEGPAADAEVLRAFRETLRDIVTAGSVPLILEDTPRPVGVPRCPMLRLTVRPKLQCEVRRVGSDSTDIMARTLPLLRAEFPTLRIIDPAVTICEGERCASEIQGLPLFFDANHLTEPASRALGVAYAARLGDPFASGLRHGPAAEPVPGPVRGGPPGPR